MGTAEISAVLAAVALLVSLFTAYRTLLSRFSGKCSTSMRPVLTHVDDIPAIGLACYFDNSGARPGALNDMRLIVKHRESGATYAFYPHLMRDDYSVFASYTVPDWFPFGGVSLSARERIERYVLFKPKNDKFSAQQGLYEATLETWWYQRKAWDSVRSLFHFELDSEVAKRWNDPVAIAIQVHSTEVQARRNIVASGKD